MKILFNKFLIALKQYAENSKGVMRLMGDKELTGAKLEFALRLRRKITPYLEKQTPLRDEDYEDILSEIQDIQLALKEKLDAHLKDPSFFDALLVWIVDRISAWRQQIALPLNALKREQVDQLSNTQAEIKSQFDELIVLLGGFVSFPDDRMGLESWTRQHSRVALYPYENGWDEKILSIPGKIESIQSQLDSVKKATLIQIRHQAPDQIQRSLYYMTLTQLNDINPKLMQGLAQWLTEQFKLSAIDLEEPEDFEKIEKPEPPAVPVKIPEPPAVSVKIPEPKPASVSSPRKSSLKKDPRLDTAVLNAYQAHVKAEHPAAVKEAPEGKYDLPGPPLLSEAPPKKKSAPKKS